MAANVSVPNTFTNTTIADATQVNADFAALVSWINTNAVHLDGAKAMTGLLSAPAGTDPSSADQYARKAYVDAQNLAQARVSGTGSKSNQSVANSTNVAITFDTEAWDSHTFVTVPSTTLVVPAGLGGIYLASTIITAPTSVTPMRGSLVVNGAYYATGLASFDVASTSNQAQIQAVLSLNAGATVGVNVIQTSGSAGLVSCTLVLHRLSV